MALALADLEVLVAVEREGSFGRAASALMLTQPAVSERVRNLERTVGRQLFERTPRGAVATPAGAALLPYARRCLALATEALDAAREAEASRSLVVAVHSTFAPRVVPLVLDAVATTPRRVSIRDVHSEDVAGLVLDGVADVGFAMHAGTPRGLIRVELPDDPIVAVASPDHPLRSIRRPSIASLRSSLLAVNAWGDGADRFATQLAEASVEDWRVRYCGDAATALTLARAHDHVAFVTRSAAEALGGDGLVRLSVAGLSGWRVRLDLLHRRSDRGDPLIPRIADAAAA
jgi:DNA-binding transcriptional LysR family regulator